MEVTGILVKVFDTQNGTSANGKEWMKKDFVIKTDAKFNPEICFTLFGEGKVNMLTQGVGAAVNVSFNLSSREYKGKYYTQANAWKIEGVKAEVEQEEDCPF